MPGIPGFLQQIFGAGSQFARSNEQNTAPFPGVDAAQPQPVGQNGGMMVPQQGPQPTTSPSLVGVLNEILQPYGLSTEEHQNAFLPNNNHPRLSNMFERAVYGAAMTRPGETAGDTINNIAQGIIGVPGAMRDARELQTLHPLAQATQMESLFGMQQKSRLQAAQTTEAMAQTKKELAQANYYNSAGRRRIWGEPFAAQDKDGQYYWAQTDATTNKSDWVTDPNGQRMKATPRSVFPTKGAQAGGRSLAERMADEDDAQRDLDGLSPKTPAERVRFVNGFIAAQAGSRASATQSANAGFDYTGQEKEIIQNYKTERDTKINEAKGTEQFKQFRREYASKNSSLEGINAAWQSHLNQIQEQAYKEYNDRVGQLRPEGTNTRPMPGSKPKERTKPKVEIKADGTISVSRQ